MFNLKVHICSVFNTNTQTIKLVVKCSKMQTHLTHLIKTNEVQVTLNCEHKGQTFVGQKSKH